MSANQNLYLFCLRCDDENKVKLLGMENSYIIYRVGQNYRNVEICDAQTKQINSSPSDWYFYFKFSGMIRLTVANSPAKFYPDWTKFSSWPFWPIVVVKAILSVSYWPSEWIQGTLASLKKFQVNISKNRLDTGKIQFLAFWTTFGPTFYRYGQFQ